MDDGQKRVLVRGTDAGGVARTVRDVTEGGARAAGYVGEDEAGALEMADELLGGVDEVVVVPGGPPGADAGGRV